MPILRGALIFVIALHINACASPQDELYEQYSLLCEILSAELPTLQSGQSLDATIAMTRRLSTQVEKRIHRQDVLEFYSTVLHQGAGDSYELLRATVRGQTGRDLQCHILSTLNQ